MEQAQGLIYAMPVLSHFKIGPSKGTFGLSPRANINIGDNIPPSRETLKCREVNLRKLCFLQLSLASQDGNLCCQV